MKDYIKHLIDCGLAFAISLFSILGATGSLEFKDVLIAFIPSALVGLIKFRDYWNTEVMNARLIDVNVKTPTIFF